LAEKNAHEVHFQGVGIGRFGQPFFFAYQFVIYRLEEGAVKSALLSSFRLTDQQDDDDNQQDQSEGAATNHDHTTQHRCK
jgi:hypothetical protein